MKIGILSDTHNNVKNLQLALATFQENEIETLIHCGDMTAVETAQYLKGFRVIFVRGNMDKGSARLFQAIRALNPENVVGTIYEGELGGKRIGATHGHLPAQMNRLLEESDLDYIFHGHSHRRRQKQSGGATVINPGALGGTRHEHRSVCIVDLETDEVSFLRIADH